VSHLLPNPAFL